MTTLDWIKNWLGSKSNGPAKRPEGGFISQHRKDDEPGIWTPPYSGRSQTVDFADLFQGRALGHQAEGYGAKLPGVLSRGAWTVLVNVPGTITKQYSVTGAGGSVVGFHAPDMALIEITIHDKWDNKLRLMAYNAKARNVSLSFRDAGAQGRLLCVVSK